MSAKLTYPLDALVSYHYYRTGTAVQALVDTGRLAMIGDSGAYSAFTQGKPIGMSEYLEWCARWSPHLIWVAALDVMGEPRTTLDNWALMLDRHGLVTVPTLHVGTDPRWMEHYVKRGVDFIALGGMVGRAIQSLPWVVQVFQYARRHHPQVRFHIWGVAHRRFLDNLPAYSADSSGVFTTAYRYGSLRLFDPATARSLTFALKGTNSHRVGRLLRDVYGVEPKDIATSHPDNRRRLIQVSALATQLYANWLSRRHRVTPPTWALKTPAHLGVRVHSVSAAAGGAADDLTTAVGLAPDRGRRELYVPDPPAGVRVHCVPGASPEELTVAVGLAQDRGRNESYLVDPPGGPRVHAVTNDGTDGCGFLVAVSDVDHRPHKEDP